MGSRGVGVEHGVIDDQLAVSLEEVAECLRPVLALEGVLLFDELPGQIAPLAAQLVAHPGELLLLRQVPLPCPEPLVVLHHLVGCHVILLLKLSRGRPPRTCSCSPPGYSPSSPPGTSFGPADGPHLAATSLPLEFCKFDRIPLGTRTRVLF